MGNFKKWLLENTNAVNQKASFTQLFQRLFPQAQIEPEQNHVKAVAMVADRNIVAHWYPGLNHRRPGDENQETESYVKLDFFHLDPGEKGDYIGDISKTGMQPNALTFMRSLLPLVRGLKQLDIHIAFDAVGMDRADSYAEVLKKMGYTLGLYKHQIQMWLAHPIESMSIKPEENPYADVAGAAKKRQRDIAAKAQAAATPPAQPGIRLSF